MKLDRVPIAGTFSKSPDFFCELPFQYITEMEGARVKGSDGQWYIDWICGLGANILGQGIGRRGDGFNEYVALYARKGIAGSLPYKIEYQAAEKLTDMLGKRVPGWDSVPLQVRWVLSGSDACNAAVRLARAITSKSKKYIVSIGYHGWTDSFIQATPPAHGLVHNIFTLTANFNDFDALNSYGIAQSSNDIAAVIVEQPSVEPTLSGPDTYSYYGYLRNWCNEHSALLIMDEVVTGMRYALGGVCERYGVHPDLICMGKALGNGYPIAALVGPREYMDWFNPRLRPDGDPVFVSSTNVGSTAGLAAADYMLSNWKQKDVDHLWTIGDLLMTSLRMIGLDVVGHGPRSLTKFDNDYARAYFMRGMAQRGILMNRPNFVCRAHTADDVAYTVKAAREVFTEMQDIKDSKYGLEDNQLPLVMFRNR